MNPALSFLLFALWTSASATQTPLPPAVPSADTCAALDGAGAFEFFGASLQDSPDLRSAQARLINSQLSRGDCRASADAGIAGFVAARPDDPELTYLRARAAVLAGHGESAEAGLRMLAAQHPELPSARVLLAAILLDKEQRVEAQALLTDVAAHAPGDLRAAFQLLRVQALDSPKGDGVGKLFTVLRDRRLPPDLRENAQATLMYVTALDMDQKETAMREGLSFQSQTPSWTKATNLARFLAEERGNYLQAREVLQLALAPPAPANALAFAHLLMAETWLLEAASVDPQPSPANAALTARARTELGGNLVPLANRVAAWHHLAALKPFVVGVVDPDARDGDGRTALCRAAQSLDPDAVRDALSAGASVDGECAGATALAYIVRAGTSEFPRRKLILALLLEHGAFPDPKLYPSSSYTAMSFCADGFPACQQELLPMLGDYKARWEARGGETRAQ